MTYVVAALMVMAALAAIAWPIIRRDSAELAADFDRRAGLRVKGIKMAGAAVEPNKNARRGTPARGFRNGLPAQHVRKTDTQCGETSGVQKFASRDAVAAAA